MLVAVATGLVTDARSKTVSSTIGSFWGEAAVAVRALEEHGVVAPDGDDGAGHAIVAHRRRDRGVESPPPHPRSSFAAGGDEGDGETGRVATGSTRAATAGTATGGAAGSATGRGARPPHPSKRSAATQMPAKPRAHRHEPGSPRCLRTDHPIIVPNVAGRPLTLAAEPPRTYSSEMHRTKTDAELAASEAAYADDPERAEVIHRARRFKAS